MNITIAIIIIVVIVIININFIIIVSRCRIWEIKRSDFLKSQLGGRVRAH